MSLPTISVVVPSLNQGAFIEATLQSIVDQGYPNLELIVIDGGSKDESVDVIRKYSSSISYWISEPDAGQTNALIKGFSRAVGDIQCWINSDDQMANRSMFQVADFFQRMPDAEAVFGDTAWMDRHGRLLRIQREIPFNRFIWLHTYNYIPCMSMYWRRSLYERVGGLDSRFDLAMDADLWSRFSDVTRIYHVRDVWSYQRFYAEQKNIRLRDVTEKEDELIRGRCWGSVEPRFLPAKRATALALRILWRAATGCYSRTYVRNLEKVTGDSTERSFADLK
ncbi:MAG: glycosyltransferase [Nitrococcus sp.]|nr:glycosyltransferase [Nitrococcus sp.]